MSIEEQLVELIEIFLNYANELLKKGTIDPLTYEKITRNKKNFLNQIISNKM